MTLSLHTAAERPDLWERGIASEEVWPEYNLHGDVLNRLWPHLDEELADFQFVLYDDQVDAVVAAETPRTGRARGMAEQILGAMSELARRHGLERVIAPVRPSAKERYPLAPIERYVTWRRDDGQLLDPWMRVHERLGARVATPLPESLRITGTVAEWESWTQMVFPESGRYVFPEGLATLEVDREADRGAYWEPNVWMIHPELR